MHGKVKVVLRHGRFYVESTKPAVLQQLLKDELIAAARVDPIEVANATNADGKPTTMAIAGNELAQLEAQREAQKAAGLTLDPTTGFLRGDEPKEKDSIGAALRNDALEVSLLLCVCFFFCFLLFFFIYI